MRGVWGRWEEQHPDCFFFSIFYHFSKLLNKYCHHLPNSIAPQVPSDTSEGPHPFPGMKACFHPAPLVQRGGKGGTTPRGSIPNHNSPPEPSSSTPTPRDPGHPAIEPIASPLHHPVPQLGPWAIGPNHPHPTRSWKRMGDQKWWNSSYWFFEKAVFTTQIWSNQSLLKWAELILHFQFTRIDFLTMRSIVRSKCDVFASIPMILMGPRTHNEREPFWKVFPYLMPGVTDRWAVLHSQCVISGAFIGVICLRCLHRCVIKAK